VPRKEHLANRAIHFDLLDFHLVNRRGEATIRCSVEARDDGSIADHELDTERLHSPPLGCVAVFKVILPDTLPRQQMFDVIGSPGRGRRRDCQQQILVGNFHVVDTRRRGSNGQRGDLRTIFHGEVVLIWWW